MAQAPTTKFEPLNFTRQDKSVTGNPLNDIVAVTTLIISYQINSILIDTKSFVNKSIFNKKNLKSSRLTPIASLHYIFSIKWHEVNRILLSYSSGKKAMSNLQL